MWKPIKWTALVALLIVQFLNHTGFCYRNMRYYSDIEIAKMVRGRAAPIKVDHFSTSWHLRPDSGVIARSFGIYYGTYVSTYHDVKPGQPLGGEGPIDACGDVPRWWN